jgi:site-specific DNA recombinase
LNLGLEIDELTSEQDSDESINITEEQIRNMFGKFKEFVLNRNLPECKKFISDYVKEVIVYRDYVEVIFNVVFSFAENEISHDFHIKENRKAIL